MAQSSQPSGSQPRSKKQRLEKSYDILTCTAKNPSFSYVHLELITNSPPSTNTSISRSNNEDGQLDNLMLMDYCTAALRQSHGLTGAAVPIDILRVHGCEGWVRIPRPDLSLFAAAVTAWRGASEGEELRLLRVKQCSDWLGSMVGSDGQDRLWDP